MTEHRDLDTFILEDDVDMHILLRNMLDDEGLHNVYLFSHSKELFAKLHPGMRVLVIDWRLDEDMNGLQVMEKVREKNPGCYVIVVTGYSDEQMIIDFLNAKADRFIKKHPQYLYELIREIKRGLEVVSKRDALMHRAWESYHRIEKKRKQQDENDAGSAH